MTKTTIKTITLTKVSIDIETDNVVLHRIINRNQYRFAIPKTLFSHAEYGAVMMGFVKGFHNTIKIQDNPDNEGTPCLAINDVRVIFGKRVMMLLQIHMEHVLNDPHTPNPLIPLTK